MKFYPNKLARSACCHCIA